MSVSKAGLGIFLGGVGVSANQNEGIALAAANILGFRANNGVRAGVSSAGFVARSSNAYVWSSGDNVTAAFDLALYRGGAGILEQRDAANAQSPLVPHLHRRIELSARGSKDGGWVR